MENEYVNEYVYEERIINKNEDFPELTIIENALDSVQEYYQRKRIEYINKHNNDKSFNLNEKLAGLKKAEARAKELVAEIRKSMNEYKTISAKLSSYESKKIKEKIELLNDKKIIKTYANELKKINSQKLKAKEQIIKSLKNKNLKLVDTLLNVKNNSTNKEYLVEKNIGSTIGVHQNLGTIIEQLDLSNRPEIIANQFVTQTETNAIEGRNVYQNKDYENWSRDQEHVTVSTPGANIYVSDGDMKKDVEFNKLTDEQKIEKIQNLITDSQPLIGKIETILKSQTNIDLQQKNMLKITKDAYKKLSQINLEFDRVRTTMEFLKQKNTNNILPKTQQLLEKYFSKLVHQQKEQLEKAKELAQKTNLDMLIKRDERNEKLEQLGTNVRVSQTRVDAARTDAEKRQLEKNLKQKQEEYYNELNYSEAQEYEQPQGRRR